MNAPTRTRDRTTPSPVASATLLGLVVGATVALPLLPRLALPTFGLAAPLGARVGYQIAALLLTLAVLGAARLLAPGSTRLLALGDPGAPVTPAPAMGLNPKPHETWRHVGRNFAVVLPTITAVVVAFQVISGNDVSAAAALRALPVAVVLSVMNAFTEELICRYGVLAALLDRHGPRVAVGVSAGLFGAVHFVGVPGGLPGVALAGFLGWLLAKSIVETRGMFWALVLHTLVDVPIITALLVVA